MSLAGAVAGIMGMIGCNDDVTKIVAFAIVTAASILGYIIAEGKVDAAAVNSAADGITKILDMIADLKASQGIEVAAEDLAPLQYCQPLDPVSRAIYDLAPNATTTISITKAGGVEMQEVTDSGNVSESNTGEGA